MLKGNKFFKLLSVFEVVFILCQTVKNFQLLTVFEVVDEQDPIEEEGEFIFV